MLRHVRRLRTRWNDTYIEIRAAIIVTVVTAFGALIVLMSAITNSRPLGWPIAIATFAVIGLSLGWWQIHDRLPHKHPANREDRDEESDPRTI